MVPQGTLQNRDAGAMRLGVEPGERWRRLRCGHPCRRGACQQPWPDDCHAGATGWRATDLPAAVGRADHGVGDGQPEARAAWLIRRPPEPIEDLTALVGGDAGARVVDDQLDAV